jgi:hypothetical protein
MKKPKSLRDHLTACVPHIKLNPDCLQVFISSGNVATTASVPSWYEQPDSKAGESRASLSCEYSYTLELLITDYASDPDTLIIPILAWLRTNQFEMLENTKLMAEGFKFEVDYITHDSFDLSIKLQLTERLGVTEIGNKVTVTHFDEPGIQQEDDVTWEFIYPGNETLNPPTI